ncbi:hypothetical protein ACFFX0_04840 [Citricoccus parietis]|uniref:Uncharacterized protein n=1 Tax=Citricoccus parietis TaxID=592307 RepID=A0ABV5FV43_9MICC
MSEASTCSAPATPLCGPWSWKCPRPSSPTPSITATKSPTNTAATRAPPSPTTSTTAAPISDLGLPA